MSEITCAHPSCSCPVAVERSFCAAWCEEMADQPVVEDDGCGCGREKCLGVAGLEGRSALEAKADDLAPNG